MTKYELINPYIEGEFDRTFNGKSHNDAGKAAWEAISQHVTNNVPRFAFTIRKVSDGTLHHFEVSEQVEGETVDYNLNKLSLKTTKKQEGEFNSCFNKFKNSKLMTGGRRHHKKRGDDDDDSSSTSDSDSDGAIYNQLNFYRNINGQMPIYYWWYYPSWYNFSNIFIPTFTGTPYIDIVFPYTTTTIVYSR